MRSRRFVTLLIILLAAFSQAQELELPAGRRIDLICQRTLSTHPRGGVLGLIGVKPITREDTLMMFEVARDVYTEDGTLSLPKSWCPPDSLWKQSSPSRPMLGNQLFQW